MIRGYLDVTPAWAFPTLGGFLYRELLDWSGWMGRLGAEAPVAGNQRPPGKIQVRWRKYARAAFFIASLIRDVVANFLPAKTGAQNLLGTICSPMVTQQIVQEAISNLVSKRGLSPIITPLTSSLVFALTLSFTWRKYQYPSDLESRGDAEVSIKNAATPVRGKLVFDLERFVLIQVRDESLVAISQSEVQPLRTELPSWRKPHKQASPIPPPFSGS